MAVLAAVLLAVLAAFGLTPSARASTVQTWSTPGPGLIDAAQTPAQAGRLVTHVVLPTGYAHRGCWPVLYLLHGTQAGDDPVARQWLQLDHGALARMHIPAIVVLPGSGDSWYVNDWFGGARRPAFETWMLRDVIPRVAQRLHVCLGRSEHSIAGLSMGGYGAVYLASQLPGYFGSAGSFSGPLGPDSPNFHLFSPDTTSTVWGPLGRFYAVAHDPTALVANLRHTRVFVATGDGTPIPGEIDVASLRTEETEYEQESAEFVDRARRAGVAVTSEVHGGEHSDLTWVQSLRDMLAWNPWSRVLADPSRWDYATASTSGSAWGYRFAFSAPPTRVEQLQRVGGLLRVRGGGTAQITTPSGETVTAQVPFDLRHGRATPAPGARAPALHGSRRRVKPVSLSLTPAAPEPRTPIVLRFTTPVHGLPAGDDYQVGRIALSDTTGSCDDDEYLRLGRPAPGGPVTATLSPPADATFPNTWCSGRALFALSEVRRSAPANLPGTFLGFARITISG